MMLLASCATRTVIVSDYCIKFSPPDYSKESPEHLKASNPDNLRKHLENKRTYDEDCN